MPNRPAAESLNNTARVLLGMIAEGHSTGYAIKAEIERSTRLFWGASVGGIYPELRRLTAAGLVAVRDDPRGQTRRHCYSITDAGREALHAWLSDDSEPLFEMRNEALLRLRFAGVLSGADRVALVHRLRELHEERVRALEERLATEEFDDMYDRMTAEYALGLNRWGVDWARAAEERVAAGESQADQRLGAAGHKTQAGPSFYAQRSYFIDR
jgi:PadR family transcriptional regulator, regulatory protein AphA